MKILVTIASVALMSAATLCAAAEPPEASAQDKAVMLYVSKSFGSLQRQNRTPLAFGFRLQQSSPLEWNRKFDLVDLRFDGTRHPALLVGGLRAFESSDESSGASSSLGSKHPGWTATMIIMAVLAAGCAIEWCDGGGDPNYETPAPTPTPTGPG